MLQLGPALGLAILGSISALLLGAQQWSDRHTKSKTYLAILVGAILVQIVTQGFQYLLSEDYRQNVQKRMEAETATTLATFLFGNEKLLVDSTNIDYLVGYRFVKNGEYDKAKPFFGQSIRMDHYVAPSHYLLAYIYTHLPGRGEELNTSVDWTPAYDELKAAIEYDNMYGSAYYLRAILEVAGGRREEALSDLKRATGSPYASLLCYEIIEDPKERALWSRVESDSRFQDELKKCKAKFKTFYNQ